MKVFIITNRDNYCGCVDGDCCYPTHTSICGVALSRADAVAYIEDVMNKLHLFPNDVRKAVKHLQKHNEVKYGYLQSFEIDELDTIA